MTRTSTKRTEGKSKSPAIRQQATPSKDFPRYHAESEPGPGRWIRVIGPGETAYIADNVVLYVVIKNNGPSTVLVSTSHEHSEKLVANVLRVIPVMGPLTLETMDDEYAIVEMEFLPKSKF